VILRVLEVAELEAIDAIRSYEEKCIGLGRDFLARYKTILSNIEEQPTRFPLLETLQSSDREIRRCLFQRFPYYVVFELLEEECVVLAVAHASREPNYWLGRGPDIGD
jgi:toxin ParE1/3/4